MDTVSAIQVEIPASDAYLPPMKLQALCVARIRALESLLGADAAVRWHMPAAPVVAFPAPAKRKGRTPKAVGSKRAAMMSGEEFHDARMAACRAVAADVGEAWHLVEGASHWCTIPNKLRSFTTKRGTKIRCHADARLPAARYWPEGKLPEGIIEYPDMPRDRSPRSVVLRQELERRVGMLRNSYKYARRTAARYNIGYHSGRVTSYSGFPLYDADDRAREIQTAWDQRKELRTEQARLASVRTTAQVIALSVRRNPRAELMSAEMDWHAHSVTLRNNKRPRAEGLPESVSEQWRKTVQAAWDARKRLRAARAAVASDQLPMAA